MRKITITLDEHLANIAAHEMAKPPSKRLKIPAIAAIAKGARCSRQTIYQFINRETKRVNIETLGNVIEFLNASGFKTELSDVLQLREEES